MITRSNLIIDMWGSRVRPTFAKGYKFNWALYADSKLPYRGNIYKDDKVVGDFESESLELVENFFEGEK